LDTHHASMNNDDNHDDF